MARRSLKVRRATKRDLPAILVLVKQWYSELGKEQPSKISSAVEKACFGRVKTDTLLLAEDRDGVIGFAYVRKLFEIGSDLPQLWMDDLFVTKNKRNSGVGDKLMSAVARLAKQEKAMALVWAVHTKNRRGKKFYDRLGAVKGSNSFCVLKGKALTEKAKGVRKI